MRKSYYNISSTTNATSVKVPIATNKSTATSRENLLQQCRRQNETYEELLCNIREMLVATKKKVPLQHSTSFVATLKMNHCKNNDEIWLAGTLAITKLLDLEGEEEEEEEGADLDPVGERRGERPQI